MPDMDAGSLPSAGGKKRKRSDCCTVMEALHSGTVTDIGMRDPRSPHAGIEAQALIIKA